MPFHLHESQAFIVGSLFGWVRIEDDSRRFRIAYVEEGKGNGKSPLAGGIGLYGMIADGEPRAEVYAAATKRDQAMILFRDAVAMTNFSPPLAKRLKQSGRDDKVWNLFDPKTNSFFRPISSDDGQSGPRPHIGLIDELHEHKTATMINMMSAGRKWRRQPLIFTITNSGTDRKSVCYEYREKGIQTVQRIQEDDTFFAYICAMDPEDDPFEDESCWIKANPTLGTIIQPQYLRDEVNGARGMPSREAAVRRLNFCEWTEAHSPFIPYDSWVAAGRDYTLEKFRGSTVIAGIDLSATTDLTSVVFAMKDADEVVWLWPMFWIPEDDLSDRGKKDGVPYPKWVKDGVVFTTPGGSIDKDFVVSTVESICGKYDIEIEKAPYDRHRIDVLKAALSREGANWELEPFGQGFVSMGPAVDCIEVALRDKSVRHPKNPCFDWNAANAVVTTNPVGDRKFDKSKAVNRIDGIVAAAQAMKVLDTTEPKKPKKYQIFVVGKQS